MCDRWPAARLGQRPLSGVVSQLALSIMPAQLAQKIDIGTRKFEDQQEKCLIQKTSINHEVNEEHEEKQ